MLGQMGLLLCHLKYNPNYERESDRKRDQHILSDACCHAGPFHGVIFVQDDFRMRLRASRVLGAELGHGLDDRLHIRIHHLLYMLLDHGRHLV